MSNQKRYTPDVANQRPEFRMGRISSFGGRLGQQKKAEYFNIKIEQDGCQLLLYVRSRMIHHCIN
jgi:hypothetical protein